ncbi:hypothetical protein BASA81_015170 [Batrachochytrium salamandrivorans]|nr:hypothetical protein BASA81_015170 [Batrachochytrium salamandrivorans]
MLRNSAGGEEVEGAWRWKLVEGSGIGPLARSGAASAIHGNKLYVYGGLRGTTRLSDMYSLSLDGGGEDARWQRIEYQGQGPGARECNAMLVVGRVLYLFGGFNGADWLGDLHVFDFSKQRWSLVHAQTGRIAPRFGTVFASRTGEDGNTRELVVWGGFDGQHWLRDLNLFDLATLAWKSAGEQGGDGPTARSCPSWAQVSNTVYLFAGYDGRQTLQDLWALDLATLRWREIVTCSPPPSPRYFHASAVFGSKLLVFGGYSGANRLNDLHAYDLRSNLWTCGLVEDHVHPSPRSSFVMHAVDQTLWVFAGFNGLHALGDCFSLKLPKDCAVAVQPSSLHLDLAVLVNHLALHDTLFVLVDDGGCVVHAVAALLAVRSEHFRALLFGGMRETALRVGGEPIPLSNIARPTLLALLHFAYTDRLSLFSLEEGEAEAAVLVLAAGERLLFGARLAQLCISFVMDAICLGNAVGILLAVDANLSREHRLRELVLDWC